MFNHIHEPADECGSNRVNILLTDCGMEMTAAFSVGFVFARCENVLVFYKAAAAALKMHLF